MFTINDGFDCSFLVRVSYLQIYNEDVCDLLGKNPTTKLEVCMSVYCISIVSLGMLVLWL